MGQNRVRHVRIGSDDALHPDVQAMAGEVMRNIGAGNFVALDVSPDGDHLDGFRARKKRHCIADGAGGIAAAVPAEGRFGGARLAGPVEEPASNARRTSSDRLPAFILVNTLAR